MHIARSNKFAIKTEEEQIHSTIEASNMTAIVLGASARAFSKQHCFVLIRAGTSLGSGLKARAYS